MEHSRLERESSKGPASHVTPLGSAQLHHEHSHYPKSRPIGHSQVVHQCYQGSNWDDSGQMRGRVEMRHLRRAHIGF